MHCCESALKRRGSGNGRVGCVGHDLLFYLAQLAGVGLLLTEEDKEDSITAAFQRSRGKN